MKVVSVSGCLLDRRTSRISAPVTVVREHCWVCFFSGCPFVLLSCSGWTYNPFLFREELWKTCVPFSLFGNGFSLWGWWGSACPFSNSPCFHRPWWRFHSLWPRTRWGFYFVLDETHHWYRNTRSKTLFPQPNPQTWPQFGSGHHFTWYFFPL